MKRGQGKKNKGLYIGVVIAIILAIVFIVVKAFSQTKTPEVAESKYETVTVKKTEPLMFKGTVSAEKTQAVYLDASLGKIDTIAVKDGQEVSKGDTLVVYQNREVAEQADSQAQSLDKLYALVDSAQQDLNNANTKLADLQNKQATTPVQPDETPGSAPFSEEISAQKEAVTQAQKAVNMANLDVEEALANVGRSRDKVESTVTADMDGIVYVNEQGRTNATTAVVTVVSPETTIKGTVSQYEYAQLKPKQAVKIQPVSDKEEVNGTITEVSKLPESTNTAEGATSQGQIANYPFTVKPEKNLTYGYNVQITLPIDDIRVAKKAIIEEDGKMFVYVVKDGKAQKQEIEGQEDNGLMIVKKGLVADDVLIVNPDKDLTDGTEVAVL